jgi:ABC-type multidrug transport system permease subunit
LANAIGHYKSSKSSAALRKQRTLSNKANAVWLQDVVKVNPVSYAVDGVRQLLIGATGMTSLLIDFAVVIGFATVLSTIGIVLSWRFLSK